MTHFVPDVNIYFFFFFFFRLPWKVLLHILRRNNENILHSFHQFHMLSFCYGNRPTVFLLSRVRLTWFFVQYFINTISNSMIQNFSVILRVFRKKMSCYWFNQQPRETTLGKDKVVVIVSFFFSTNILICTKHNLHMNYNGIAHLIQSFHFA